MLPVTVAETLTRACRNLCRHYASANDVAKTKLFESFVGEFEEFIRKHPMLNETFLDQIPDLPHKGVRLAVLGHPIKHSISPQLHESALAVLAEKRASIS